MKHTTPEEMGLGKKRKKESVWVMRGYQSTITYNRKRYNVIIDQLLIVVLLSTYAITPIDVSELRRLVGAYIFSCLVSHITTL